MRIDEIAHSQYLVTFDDKWGEFMSKVAENDHKSFDEVATLFGYDPSFIRRIWNAALYAWKDSTSTSLINGLMNLSSKLTQPHTSMTIFDNIEQQMRFAVKAQESRLLGFLSTEVVKNKNQIINIGGYALLKFTNKGKLSLNNLLRQLWLYWYFNTKNDIKLPKWIYRGIRVRDIFNHDTIKPLVDHIWKMDTKYEMRRKQVIDIITNYIIEHGLSKITEKVLSFSASASIASYFANNEGLIIRVDPKRVEIITSELHDEVLDQTDYVSKKHEKEYIAKIPHDYKFDKSDIEIVDLDYYVAEENPLAVAHHDGSSKKFKYTMNGTNIVARWQWNSNGIGGKVVYNIENDWFPVSRTEFKKTHGFDPLPTKKNISDITNFAVEDSHS